MPSLQRSALVAHSASNMYRLVHDVEAYPQFLPWCELAKVEELSEFHQVAQVGIGKFFQQSTFRTRNTLVENTSIEMLLLEGPFKQLRGHWCFTPLADNACKVELNIEFEFSNAILAQLIRPTFTSVCDTLVNAFVDRANAVYV